MFLVFLNGGVYCGDSFKWLLLSNHSIDSICNICGRSWGPSLQNPRYLPPSPRLQLIGTRQKHHHIVLTWAEGYALQRYVGELLVVFLFWVAHQSGLDHVAVTPTEQGSCRKLAFTGGCHFLLVFQLLSDTTGMVVDFLPTHNKERTGKCHLNFMYGGASMLDANSILVGSNVLGGSNDVSAEVGRKTILCSKQVNTKFTMEMLGLSWNTCSRKGSSLNFAKPFCVVGLHTGGYFSYPK